MHTCVPILQLSSTCSPCRSMGRTRSIHPGHKHTANAKPGGCTRSLPADDTPQEKRAPIHKDLGHCGLFLTAFIGTMEKLEGGLNVRIKLQSQNFTPGFIAIWSLKTCRSNDLFKRSEVCTTSESPILHRTYLGNVDLVHARRDFQPQQLPRSSLQRTHFQIHMHQLRVQRYKNKI